MNDPLKDFSTAETRHRKAPAKTMIGWRERVDLPDLGLFGLIAKIDTGARTSSLHVDHIEPLATEDGQSRARIYQKVSQRGQPATTRTWDIEIAGFRSVKSSNGFVEERALIKTTLRMGEWVKAIEFTLTNRKSMRYEILIGRTALRRGFLVDPSRSYLLDE